MQPQDGGGFDWWHAFTGAGGGIVGTFLTWFWRAARVEPSIRSDFRADIIDAERRVKTEIEEAERRAEQKVEDMASHFHEAFAGIRQQINDVGKNSLPREEFNNLRRENREDFASVNGKFDSLNDKIDVLMREILLRLK